MAGAPIGELDSGALTPSELGRRLQATAAAISGVLWGQLDVVRLALAAVVARGHILIDDIPGVGKTTLARALARALGCSFSRLQFTADMLPADVLGMQVLDPKEGTLRFHKGPIFSQIVLADELNRASPRTQSALLEAMAERSVTIDEVTYSLPEVFTVLATQNPVEHHGAYPLPESQLDRFAMRLTLGYPPPQEERRLVLSPTAPHKTLESLVATFDPALLCGAQEAAARVHLDSSLADYVLAIVTATRRHSDIVLGASPRAGMTLAQVARSWALLDRRDYVVPDDVQVLVVPTLAHRLVLRQASAPDPERRAAVALLQEIVGSTPVPR